MKYQGTVKWFSNKKGFGFIAPTSENCPAQGEIFVHQTAILTNGAYRTIRENATVQFEVEKDADGEKYKAINVTNPDGTPIVPPPRERRRRGAKDDKGGSGGEEGGGEAKATTTEDNQEEKPKKTGNRSQRKPRNKNNNSNKEEKPAAAPKEAPFHATLDESVKKIMQNKGLELGKRTTVDVAVGDARIKLGQGGYAGCAMAAGIVGEGTYTCDDQGKVTFHWERSIEYKDNAWKKGDPSTLVATISLSDESVGPVNPDDTPEKLWGKDVPEPQEAFEENEFLMRRVVLTRPRRAPGGANGTK